MSAFALSDHSPGVAFVPTAADPAPALSKKALILAAGGKPGSDIEAIAAATGTRPSYVAAVLGDAGLLPVYFDLYTATAPMNIYSPLFRGKVGYRDVATAKASVALMEELYQEFAADGDRAGQHHVLFEALQLFDRARWAGKPVEARLFRQFLRRHTETGRLPQVVKTACGVTAALACMAARATAAAWKGAHEKPRRQDLN